MTNKATILRFLGINLALAGFVLVSGSLTEVSAQRDPFTKPGWARTRDGGPGAPGGPKKSGPPADLGVPAIDQRIDYYKRLRETAAVNGQSIPKVTSVLTLNEMSVTGIFHTPRGYAAMVEAMPLRLSYTIYPGEKFFDGQLVAVEENRLVFRRVTKMSNGKFVSSVENKGLRKYTDRDLVQGMAPQETAQAPAQQSAPLPVASSDLKPAGPASIVSPLEEMNRQVPSSPEKEKPKKDSKKSAKVAKGK